MNERFLQTIQMYHILANILLVDTGDKAFRKIMALVSSIEALHEFRKDYERLPNIEAMGKLFWREALEQTGVTSSHIESLKLAYHEYKEEK